VATEVNQDSVMTNTVLPLVVNRVGTVVVACATPAAVSAKMIPTADKPKLAEPTLVVMETLAWGLAGLMLKTLVAWAPVTIPTAKARAEATTAQVETTTALAKVALVAVEVA